MEKEFFFISPPMSVPVKNDFVRGWRKAKLYFREGNYEASLDVLNKLEKIGYQLEVVRPKGLIYRLIGDYKSARKTLLQVLKKARKAGPDELFLHLKWNHIYIKSYDLHYRREKTDRGIKILKKALEKEVPDRIELHVTLARIFEDTKEFNSVIEEINKIISLEKENKKKAEWLCYKAGILENLGDYTMAEKILSEAINFRSDYAKAYAIRARIKIRQDKDELALKDWEKADELDFQGGSPFYLLMISIYLKQGNMARVEEKIDGFLENYPDRVKDIFESFQTQEVYNLLFNKIFNLIHLKDRENSWTRTNFIRILEYDGLDKKLALEALWKHWIDKIIKVEKSSKRGKKIKGRDRRILEFIENAETDIAKILAKEREKSQILMRSRRILMEVLRLIGKTRGEELEKENRIVKEFLDQYSNFINLEEFQFHLDWVRERRRFASSLLKEIDKVVKIFLKAFNSKNQELIIRSISLEKEPSISMEVRVVEEWRDNYSLSFFFNLASNVLIDEVEMKQSALRFAEQAELWANLPGHLAGGLILKVPEEFDFKKYLTDQEITAIIKKYDQQIIKRVDQESLNLMVDILKCHIKSKTIENEFKFLKSQKLPYWEEILAIGGDHLSNKLPVLAREAVAVEKISGITLNKKLQAKFGRLFKKYEELLEMANGYAQFKEVYMYYRNHISKNILVYEMGKVKKRKKFKVRFNEEIFDTI